MDGWTGGRYQVHYLICFTVDNYYVGGILRFQVPPFKFLGLACPITDPIKGWGLRNREARSVMGWCRTTPRTCQLSPRATLGRPKIYTFSHYQAPILLYSKNKRGQ